MSRIPWISLAEGEGSVGLTFDAIRRVLESLPPAPPALRPSHWVPRGQAFQIEIPKWAWRPGDPKEVVYVNPEDLKNLEMKR